MKKIPLLVRRLSIIVASICMFGIIYTTLVTVIYFAFVYTSVLQQMIGATALQVKIGITTTAVIIGVGYGILIKDFCRYNW